MRFLVALLAAAGALAASGFGCAHPSRVMADGIFAACLKEGATERECKHRFVCSPARTREECVESMRPWVKFYMKR